MHSWEAINKMTLDELERTSKELFRKANYRLFRLGATKPESAAYRQLLSYTGADYLSDENKLDARFKMPEDVTPEEKQHSLRQAIGVAERFLESATSTKKGVEAVQRNHRKWIRANYDGFNKNKDADEFLRFLGSDAVKAEMKTFDSNVIVEALAKANKQRGSQSLKEAFEQFKKSGKSYGAWIIELENVETKKDVKRIDF